MIKKIDHIAIAVKSIDDALDMYKSSFGLEAAKIETYEEVKATIAFIPVGCAEIHLITSTEPGAGMIGQFLEEQGEGIHHIGLTVEDIEQVMERLEGFNMPCMDKEPIEVGDGSRVAFTNPAYTHALYELLEKGE